MGSSLDIECAPCVPPGVSPARPAGRNDRRPPKGGRRVARRGGGLSGARPTGSCWSSASSPSPPSSSTTRRLRRARLRLRRADFARRLDFEALAFDLALALSCCAPSAPTSASAWRAGSAPSASACTRDGSSPPRGRRGTSRASRGCPACESVTARAAASARSARTSVITFAGRRARAACTRFVSSTTNISRSGSIQSDVPVKPVWP